MPSRKRTEDRNQLVGAKAPRRSPEARRQKPVHVMPFGRCLPAKAEKQKAEDRRQKPGERI